MIERIQHFIPWKRAGRRAVVCVLLGLLYAGLASAADVTIETGRVEGTARDGMTVYLGISLLLRLATCAGGLRSLLPSGPA